MKLTYQSGKFTVAFEADEQTGLFQQIATFQEVFEHTACEKCKSTNLKFVVRQSSEGDDYYELRCLDCGAKLAFGQNKKGGTLYPKRKDKDGEWLPNGGWVKWNAETKKEE